MEKKEVAGKEAQQNGGESLGMKSGVLGVFKGEKTCSCIENVFLENKSMENCQILYGVTHEVILSFKLRKKPIFVLFLPLEGWKNRYSLFLG